MFDKLSQIAERTATNVSRRQFLGRLGSGAMAAAAAVAGLLALSDVAKAAPSGTLCDPANSWYVCTNSVVGGSCGANGKCVAQKGTINHCYCRNNGSPGPRR